MRDEQAMRLIRETAQLIEKPGDDTVAIYLRLTPTADRIRIDSAEEISALDAVRSGIKALQAEERRIRREAA
jgi:hypothetical protein